MNEPSVFAKLAVNALMFAVAYAFWSAYRDPTRNGVTRLLCSYMNATSGGLRATGASMLIIAVITLVIAIAALISIVASIPWT